MRKDKIVFNLLKRDLENYQPTMTNDLVDMLLGKSVVYLENYQKSDLVYFYGEYCYKHFTSSFWAMNKKGDIISYRIDLPVQEKTKEFLSKEFKDKEISLEDNLYDDELDEDEITDILDEFSEEIHSYFKNWFRECWLTAIEISGIKIEGYFSVHDSYIHTELNSNKSINDDEILEKMSKI